MAVLVLRQALGPVITVEFQRFQPTWLVDKEGDRLNSESEIRETTKNKVLIAHPSSAQRAAIEEMLGSEQFHLIFATDTSDALAQISVEHVDLVLIGLNMPELGAIEFCRIIKKASGTRFLPVFVTSATDCVELEVKAIEAGADAFVVEPFRAGPLQARIQAILRHKSMIESLDDSEVVLFSLAQSVEDRDPGLGQHCERIAQMCTAMGLSMGLPPQDILTLQRAGYLHDVGKVAIPDSILFKRGPLTDDEWKIMQSHAERGERICRNVRSLASALPVIRHHHEKWNGTGYPDKLAGEEIPLLARILQTADIYDALTTERPYKKAYSPDEAIAIMRNEASKGWRDPVLTEQFADVLPMFRTVPTPDISQLSLRALAHSLAQSVPHPVLRPVALQPAC